MTTTYYVNGASGSDSNNGLTLATAFKTVSHAAAIYNGLSAATQAASVTILIAAGTYSEAGCSFSPKTGSNGGLLIVTALTPSWLPNVHIILTTNPGVGIGGFYVNNTASRTQNISTTTVSGVLVSYIEFSDGSTGTALIAGTEFGVPNATIQDCYVHDVGIGLAANSTGGAIDCIATGDGVNSSGFVAQRNLVLHCGPTAGGTLYHGIYPGSPYCVIQDNVIGNCPGGWGIHAYAGTTHALIQNNTIFNCAVGCIVWGSPSIASTQNRVYNNVCYGGVNSEVALESQSANPGSVDGSDVENNVCWANTSLNGFQSHDKTTYTSVKNVAADPLFVAYATDGSGDYHLHHGSPAIGAGNNLGPAPTTDLTGLAWPTALGYDIGAYSWPASANNAYGAVIGGAPANVIAGTLSVQNQIGQRSTGGVSVWSARGVYWPYGTQIQVYDGLNERVYAGYTIKDKITKGGARLGKGYLEHQLTLMDNCYKADKRVVFASYLNQTAGSIVTDLLGKALAAEGVTTLPGSIGNGATIVEVVWNGKQISSALDWLATQSGYWWDIDLNGVLWFQPYAGVPAPFVLDGTQVESGKLGNLSVTFGNDMYVNKQYAKGAYAQKGSQTETFHGDGTRRNFTLSYELASSSARDLSILVNGVAQTFSTKGSSGTQWYAAVGDAVIAQDPSQTVLGSGDTLSVTYKGRYPVIAVALNPTLIAAQKSREGVGSSGIVESVYANTKVHSLSAAFQIASAMLAHYGADTTVLEFDTRTTGLQQGQMLTVNLADFGLSGKQMLITSITLSDQNDGYLVWYHVMCVGSPYDAAQWQTYWQNLMNQSSDPSDLSDTADTSLALLLDSTLTRTPSVTVTKTTTICPIIGNSTIIGSGLIVC